MNVYQTLTKWEYGTYLCVQAMIKEGEDEFQILGKRKMVALVIQPQY